MKWEKMTLTEWRAKVDHYHTARILVEFAPFARRNLIYSVSYGVHSYASTYTLKAAKLTAAAIARQEGWKQP